MRWSFSNFGEREDGRGQDCEQKPEQAERDGPGFAPARGPRGRGDPADQTEKSEKGVVLKDAVEWTAIGIGGEPGSGRRMSGSSAESRTGWSDPICYKPEPAPGREAGGNHGGTPPGERGDDENRGDTEAECFFRCFILNKPDVEKQQGREDDRGRLGKDRPPPPVKGREPYFRQRVQINPHGRDRRCLPEWSRGRRAG